MNNIRKTNKRKTPVTIIVGIIYDGGIVLASDSQTSYDPGSSKRTDTDKISAVTFDGKDGVLVAQAGNAELSSRTVEIFTKLAHATPLNDYRKPAELAEDALRQLKQEIIRLNDWSSNREFAHEYFQDSNNNFALMVAYHYGKEKPEPLIYTLNFWPGIATKRYNYATLGCGSTVAEFILSQAKVSDMKEGHALMTAIYTVEQVKKVDSFCGGLTKVAFVKKDGARIPTKEGGAKLIKAAVESFEEHEEKTRIAWRGMMDTIATAALDNYKKKHPDKNEDKKDE